MPFFSLSNSNDIAGRPIIRLGVQVSSFDREDDPAGTTQGVCSVTALIDTGAEHSQVSLTLLKELGISSTSDIDVYTASTGDSPVTKPLYLVDVLLNDDNPGLLARNLTVIGSDKIGGLKVDMLLGRDVLNRCLLIYDGTNRRFTLAYNPPPPPQV